ncbi:MAG TPA: 3-oxoacyl-ACP reductase family protein [Bacillota bacterium]|nr:3-oxoacyl-ACP reductase family protein [Bacillota bacterium]
MGRLDGRVALVTGGSRGFGRATALRFAAEGADVVVNYRSAEAEAREVAAEITRGGRRAVAVQADIGSAEDCLALADAALKDFGHLDILVNNAGIMDVRPFADQGPADWQAMLDVNVWGTLRLTHALIPALRASGRGRVINLSSQLGHVGGENFAVYSGTKGFILAYTKSLARELGPFGITVNAICPGSIITDMNRGIYPPERQATRARELPLRRMGDPDDIAAAALYLASDDARFMTGQCVDVNGGGTMA